MIIDIPTKQEFFDAAETLIHGAWASLVDLVAGGDELALAFDTEPELSTNKLQEYWRLARPTLISSLSLVQQAVEFYLKAEIASVSPYLLISGDVRRWPKQYEENDTRFPDFRGVDAQDLPRLYNTVTSKRLTADVSMWFHDLRNRRNRIIHTVDSQFAITPAQLAETVLRAHEYLVGERQWLRSTRWYLDTTPTHGVKLGSDAEHEAYIRLKLHQEVASIVPILPHEAAVRYYGFDEELEAGSCPACTEVFEGDKFFDSRWTDGFLPTLQSLPGPSRRSACLVCGSAFWFCPECDAYSVETTNGECLACGYLTPRNSQS